MTSFLIENIIAPERGNSLFKEVQTMKSTSTVRSILLVSVVVLSLSSASQAEEPRTASDFGAMGTAKVLCSAVFVSGRDLDEALQNSAPLFLPTSDRKLLLSRSAGEGDTRIVVDREHGTVEVTVRGFTGRARFYGDQGCVILPPGHDRVFFEPVKVTTTRRRTFRGTQNLTELFSETAAPFAAVATYTTRTRIFRHIRKGVRAD